MSLGSGTLQLTLSSHICCAQVARLLAKSVQGYGVTCMPQLKERHNRVLRASWRELTT